MAAASNVVEQQTHSHHPSSAKHRVHVNPVTASTSPTTSKRYSLRRQHPTDYAVYQHVEPTSSANILLEARSSHSPGSSRSLLHRRRITGITAATDFLYKDRTTNSREAVFAPQVSR